MTRLEASTLCAFVVSARVCPVFLVAVSGAQKSAES